MGQQSPEPPPEGTGAHREAEQIALEFATLVLRALTAMAARSYRGQADLAAALHAANMPMDMVLIRDALLLLERRGCVTNLVPIRDGGLLLTVTGRAIAPASGQSLWTGGDEADSSILGFSSVRSGR
jgi:hypothetical protein